MKWEYKTTKIPIGNFQGDDFILASHNGVEAFLNEFGDQEWELISVAAPNETQIMVGPNTWQLLLFFKRPVG